MDGFAQLAAWCAAFQLSMAGFAARERSGAARLRMAVGLGLGAAAARLAWGILNAPRVLGDPFLLLDVNGGFSLLGVPAGLVAAAPRGTRRPSWLAAACRPLPCALAVAKLGCLAAGCCASPLRDAASLAILGLLAWSVPRRTVTPTVLLGVPALWLALQALPSA